MQPSNAKVAIYCRVSTLHQVDKDSLPMQRKDLTAYAQLILHTTDYTIFEDAGYSGKNTERPEFQRMMRMIRAGAFTHLLVWKIDRISRNLLDFATMYAELKKLGVTFVSRNEQFDTSTAMGEAMLKIILVFAELERNMTSERVTATMISRANAGKWNGGRIPFGYDYDFETMQFSINDQEAELVRRIHDDYERKKSLLIVARQLNHEGYISVARQLHDRFGCKYIAITLRSSISANDNDWAGMLYTDGKAYFSKEYHMHIVDRVGGGDSFGGGLIYSLVDGKEPQKAIDFAVAASCLKHSIEHDFNLCSVAEVESLAGGNASGRVQR